MSDPYSMPHKTDSSDLIAMVLEIVFGLFGILGIGWLYTGNILMAIAVFIGFVTLLFVEVPIVLLTFGVTACFFIPLNIAITIISGIKARDYKRNNAGEGQLLYVVLGLAVGTAVVCSGLFLITAMTTAIGSAS